MLLMWYNQTLVTYLPTSKHLVDLYQTSLEKKIGENVDVNCAYQDSDVFDPSNLTNLDVTNFFETLEEKTNRVDGTTNIFFFTLKISRQPMHSQGNLKKVFWVHVDISILRKDFEYDIEIMQSFTQGCKMCPPLVSKNPKQ